MGLHDLVNFSTKLPLVWYTQYHMSTTYLPISESLPNRSLPVEVLVVHTTGRGLAKLASQTAEPGTLEYDLAAHHWYQTSGFRYFGTDLIGTSGASFQLANVVTQTNHSGGFLSYHRRRDWFTWAYNRKQGDFVKHGRDPAVFYDWWFERWQGIVLAPTDIVTGVSINKRSVGIDLLPDLDGLFSPEQLDKAARVIAERCYNVGLIPSRKTIVGHADLDPLRRGAVNGSGETMYGRDWDPGSGIDWPVFLNQIMYYYDNGDVAC